MRISITCAWIRCFAARIPRCQLTCLKATSARTPKTALTATNAKGRPTSSRGASRRSKARDTAWFTPFMRSARPPLADVAEPAQLLGDLRVALRVLELGDLLLEEVHDVLLV